MNTKIYTLNEENIDTNIIKEAGEVLKKGGLVAFPTETVYGLGGDALNPDSSKKIYAAKGRPSDNPLIVHISNLEALGKIVKDIPSDALKLADKYWPGPLTMIFNKNDVVPKETTGGLETVAVRMPSNKIARALIDASGGYIAAPSANLSGRPSPTVAKYVIEDMDGRIDIILDGGESDVGLESTIVDFTEGKPMILRPGYITQKMLEEA
ncbi:MAG: threonylcarbamoyl-AMP synthase, partial [Lachnospiraceae bacterium]|nr:threonylcarbamoyl-AMP synthase [Lachnospiraceae bacterium]